MRRSKSIELNLLLESLSEEKVEEKSGYNTQIVQTIKFILKDCSQHFKLIENHYRVYDGRFWKKLDDTTLRRFLSESAKHYGVPNDRADHYRFIENLEKQLEMKITPSSKISDGTILMNVQNGVLDLSSETPKLLGHDPNFNLTHLLEYDFDLEARAPKFEAFLKKVLPKTETQMALLEGVAAAFIPPKQLKLEKAMFCYGSGANGKSVFFDVISALFGPDNMSIYSLAELTDARGSHRYQVQGKLLNYASEGERAFNPAIFKQLVSKEPTSGELKYKDPVVLKDHPQIVINTNVLPSLFEGTDGLLRRLLVIPFKVQIAPNKRDKRLAQRIISEELPGVLNLLIKAIQRLRKNEDFTESSEVSDFMKEVKAESNNVRSFLDECGVQCADQSISAKGLYDYYRSYCLNGGFRQFRSYTSFNRALVEYGFEKVRKSEGLHFKVAGTFPKLATLASSAS